MRRHSIGRSTDANRRQQEKARFVGIAEIDVLVFFFHHLVAGRGDCLDDILARREVSTEGVAAVEDARPHLVPGSIVVKAGLNAGDGRKVLDAAGWLVVVPAVRCCQVNGITQAEAHAVTAPGYVLGAFRGRPVGPAKGVVVHVAELNTGRNVYVIDNAIEVIVLIEAYLHPRNAGLPGFPAVVAGVVFSTGRIVENNSRDATILSGQVIRLAPVDNVGLIEIELHGLSQHRTRFCPGEVVPGIRVDSGLRLGIKLVEGRHCPAVFRRNRSAVIDGRCHPRCLEAGKVDFCYEPLEEREYLAEGIFTAGIRGLSLIHGTVAEADVDVLLRNAGLAGVTKTVLVSVIKDASL